MHPGSISNLPDAPATAFAYDEILAQRGHLVFAGQFGYESASASGGFVTQWLPSGNPHTGPVSTLVLRESELGTASRVPRRAPVARRSTWNLAIASTSVTALIFSWRPMTAARPTVFARALELRFKLSPNWIDQLRPLQATPGRIPILRRAHSNPRSTNLDSFPTFLLRDDRPVLADDLHEEIAIEHTLNPNASLTAAIFHDHSNDTAVIGRGSETSSDFLQDFYSDAFAYDAGASASWGARLAYEQKISDLINAAVVYSYAGALVPKRTIIRLGISSRLSANPQSPQPCLSQLAPSIPHFGTQLTVGYKWIDGSVVSRQDAYGEAMYNIDPYLSVIIRQPLPSSFRATRSRRPISATSWHRDTCHYRPRTAEYSSFRLSIVSRRPQLPVLSSC